MPSPRQHWSEEEEALLEREWPKAVHGTRAELVAFFPGRTYKSLRMKAQEMGLAQEKTGVGVTQGKVIETLQERGHLTKREIESLTGLTHNAVEQALRRLAERRKARIVGKAPPTSPFDRGANLWAACEPVAEVATQRMMEKLRANAGNPFAALL